MKYRSLINLLLLLCTGCNVLGFAADTAAGPKKAGAAFVLPQRPTVVLAEKFSNPGDAVFDAEPIAHFVNDELLRNKVAPMVDPGLVYALREKKGRAYQDMTIAAVGLAIGAEQVIYLNILNSAVDRESGSEMLQGSGEVLVKVVDTTTAKTLWPTDVDVGHPIFVRTELFRRGQDGLSEPNVRTMLHRQLSDQIAKLFYSYSTE